MMFLEVGDHGPGIAPEDRERVTERFYRGKAGRNAGSGLGLAIARELAEKWGGTLSAGDTSEGASVELQLRCVRDPSVTD